MTDGSTMKRAAMKKQSATNVAGVILAGGLARRMGGGDKSLLKLAGRPLLDQVIERAAAQVDRLVLNANGDPARFAGYGLPVVADVVPDFAGPLAGILTGMHWARDNAPECKWLVSFASDTPFFPSDLVERLLQQAEQDNAPLACAVVKDEVIRCSGCGRCRCWTICTARLLMRKCARLCAGQIVTSAVR